MAMTLTDDVELSSFQSFQSFQPSSEVEISQVEVGESESRVANWYCNTNSQMEWTNRMRGLNPDESQALIVVDCGFIERVDEFRTSENMFWVTTDVAFNGG